MCGIFVYSGASSDAGNRVAKGLKRLDYRGYDSWGLAVLDEDNIFLKKQVGELEQDDINFDFPSSRLAIGHTRWATHGKVTQNNAHPHSSTDGDFVLVQNGIVDNFVELKTSLENKGYSFNTQTDTEVIVRLVEDKLKLLGDNASILEATRLAFVDLQGKNTIAVLTKDGKVVAARNGSPLVVGFDSLTKDIYLSSDTLSFAGKVDEVAIVDNNDMLLIDDGQIHLFDTTTSSKKDLKREKFDKKRVDMSKNGFPHFMLKEIHDSPDVISQVIKQDEDKLLQLSKKIKKSRQVYVIGSGTAGLAASQMAYYLRTFSGINAINLIGAESNSYFDLFSRDDLIIVLSQSGETADVLDVLEVASSKGVVIASFVNMFGSMITRMSDYQFFAEAGPEISVMSTKVLTSQLSWGYLVSKVVAGEFDVAKNNLAKLANNVSDYLDSKPTQEQLENIAKQLFDKDDVFLIGKGQNLAIVNEGMVKIIEGSYKHAHAIPAGDLKHFAITLMEEGVVVLAAISNDDVATDISNAAAEIRARGAKVIGFGQISDGLKSSFSEVIEIPDSGEISAIANVISLQLISYYLTVMLGNNVDKPRNIAKSVTVK